MYALFVQDKRATWFRGEFYSKREAFICATRYVARGGVSTFKIYQGADIVG